VQAYDILREMRKTPDACSIMRDEMDHVISHLNRALAAGITTGFADAINDMIATATAIRRAAS
jgi:hypothetical protein